MSSAQVITAPKEARLPSVSEGLNENTESKNSQCEGYHGINGNVFEGEESTEMGSQSISARNSGISKKFVNGNQRGENNNGDPFDYMKERKLSEPVMSPRYWFVRFD